MAHFISIKELKSLLNVNADTKIEVLRDKETGNRSFTINNKWYRVAREWDASKPSIFHTDKILDNGNPDWDNGILSNVDESKLKKEVIGAF
jgi:hypothetical protein